MAPCFAGTRLLVVDTGASPDAGAEVSTRGWHPLAWGRELMRRDVGTLLCAGIDPATWSAIRGHGIDVVPHAAGTPEGVLEAWRTGALHPAEPWPEPVFGGRRGRGRGGGRRRRFRGGSV
ncbi:hypothetical protein [Kiritimatiella glycovorans]|uniref:Dinitrogenase iron-molybdenum cofactor biosynthesis domain-containing protein n=1 Tax=Kiritimatiella glycovorans TaxID=1307763 RepID=A0A0G3EAW2_9BACT|nr:hypothetical protein [Kiritimatiella glycovorans]AKJ63408.1 hypothetical protein L21SP4_00122 [Kiritimatiella glycovorans]